MTSYIAAITKLHSVSDRFTLISFQWYTLYIHARNCLNSPGSCRALQEPIHPFLHKMVVIFLAATNVRAIDDSLRVNSIDLSTDGTVTAILSFTVSKETHAE